MKSTEMLKLWLPIWLVVVTVRSQGRGNYNDMSDDVEIDEEFFEDELDSVYIPGENHIKHPLIVDTTLGKVLGKRQSDEVNAFLGIPYAEPPLGKLRFRPSKPKRPWYPSIYHATKLGPECLQSELFAGLDEGMRPRDEDCLHLNIWSPINNNQSSKELYPVMIWIYGGAFIHGGTSKAEYNGGVLAAKGVVVVTFNYRVGALGFLVSTNDGLYGNYGLHDQKMAIQWVQDNIRGFGGDPNRVTLFGESAGAMSIALHLLDQQASEEEVDEDIDSDGFQYSRSHSTELGNHNHNHNQQRNRRRSSSKQQPHNKQTRRKLFHAVIMQSNPLGYRYRSLAVANFIGQAYMELLDCEDLRCLQYESADELLHVQDTLMAVPRSMGDFFTWGPVLTDSSYKREIRLRPEIAVSNMTVRQPIETVKVMQKGLAVPVLLGVNAHEGTVFVFTAFQTRMPKLVYRMLVLSFFRSAAHKILQLYSQQAEKIAIQSAYPDYRLVFANIINDYLFRCPNRYFASLLTHINTPVFLYEFALPTRTPGFTCCDGLACHTAEIPYPFGHLDIIAADYTYHPPPSETEEDMERLLLEEMQLEQEKEEQEKEVLLWQQMMTAATTTTTTTPTPRPAAHADKQPQDKKHEKQAISMLLKKASSWLMNMKQKMVADHPSSQSQDSSEATAATAGTAVAEVKALKRDELNINDQLSPLQQEENKLSLEPPLKMSPSPSSADAKVARLMMEYWTTFAHYGDPNGKHSLFGGEYLQETRPENAPWWPRLLGDLPSLRAVQDMHHMGLWKYIGGAYEEEYEEECEEEEEEEHDVTFFFSASNNINNNNDDGYSNRKPAALRRSSEEDLLPDQLQRSIPPRSHTQQAQHQAQARRRQKKRRSPPPQSDAMLDKKQAQHQQEKQFSIQFGNGFFPHHQPQLWIAWKN